MNRHLIAGLSFISFLAGCREVADPLQVSYIAIVSSVDDPTSLGSDARLQYRIRELSGTIPFDTVIQASPFDTIIVQVEPATYSVVLEEFPSYCSLRYGARQDLLVAPGSNTTIARYFASCLPLLRIETFTDGFQMDVEFIYRLRASDGTERAGLIGGNDTARLDKLPGGTYSLELGHLSTNCVVTSDGGLIQSVAIDSAGGAIARYRVVCSDETKRPHLLYAEGSYHDGAGAVVFQAIDPDRDIERYWWDLTDCHGRSILPGGIRQRRGLSTGRTAQADTVTVVSAYEVGLPDQDLAGRCMSIRVVDEYGNTTPVIEQPLATGGPAPTAAAFNAVLRGTSALSTTLHVTDPDNDFVGIFVAAELRDGILFPIDGEPDLGIYNTAGYLGAGVPDLPLGSRLQYYDIYSLIVYLVDGRGNFTRLEDRDVFR